MNIKRGLIRLWVLFSAVWSLGLLGLAAPDWYHAASFWYRFRGLQASLCDPRQTDRVMASVASETERRAAKLAEKPPLPTAEELLARIDKAPRFDPSKPSTVAPPKLNCFNVSTANGTKYVVAIDGVWSIESIKPVIFYNPELFPPSAPPTAGGYGADPSLVDLIHLPSGTGGFLAVSNPNDYGDLRFAKLLATLAFAVPIVILVLGGGSWWVAMGFKS